jgi:hypothetical protein
LIAPEGNSAAFAHASKFELSLYDANTFSVTWELVPGRGAFEKTQQDLIEAAQKAAASGRVHELEQTSSWIDFYLGRDHSAPQLGIEKVPRKQKEEVTARNLKGIVDADHRGKNQRYSQAGQ